MTHGSSFGDVHAAYLTHTAKVVALQIDDHVQFRLILLAVEQNRILAGAARPCAFDGARQNHPPTALRRHPQK